MFHRILKTSPDSALKFLKEHLHDDYHNEDQQSSHTTALQLCAKNGYIELLLILLMTTNVQINYKKKHKTALFLALEYQQSLAAQILLIFGANPQETFLFDESEQNTSVKEALRTLSIDKDILVGVLLWVAKHLELYHLTKIPESLSKLLKHRNSLSFEDQDRVSFTTPLLQDSKDSFSINMEEFSSLPSIEPKIVARLIQFANHKKQFQFSALLESLRNNTGVTSMTDSPSRTSMGEFKRISNEYDFISYSTLLL